MALGGLQTVFFLESLHTSGGIDQFLLTGKKRVALGADFHGNFFPVRFRADLVPAGALDYRIDKLRMNPFLHF
jgi:hypothetical protein